MPYLTQDRKNQIIAPNSKLSTAGDLTYKLTVAAMRSSSDNDFEDRLTNVISAYLRPSPRYEDFAIVLGCLDSTRREIKRRIPDLVRKGYTRHLVEMTCMRIELYAAAYYAEVVAPYEDLKIIQNGDVF